jgi:hypothetical protein
MKSEDFCDLVADFHEWVEAGKWVLHNEADFLSSDFLPFFWGEVGDVATREFYCALGNFAAGWKHSHDCETSH